MSQGNKYDQPAQVFMATGRSILRLHELNVGIEPDVSPEL